MNEDVTQMVDAAVTFEARGKLYDEGMEFMKKMYDAEHRQKLLYTTILAMVFEYSERQMSYGEFLVFD